MVRNDDFFLRRWFSPLVFLLLALVVLFWIVVGLFGSRWPALCEFTGGEIQELRGESVCLKSGGAP